MKNKLSDTFTEDLAKLSELLMQFATINRATYLDTNGTPESDTDHTVMLSVIACAVAASYEPHLDLGKVAQFALVHDLVEAYAGDVNTIDFEKIDHAAKEADEAKALEQITEQFGETFPWIHETISAYESLKTPEARFVKTLDKAMPALTHLHTNSQAVHDSFDDPEAFEESVNKRHSHILKTYGHDQELALGIRSTLIEKIIENKYEHHGKTRKPKT